MRRFSRKTRMNKQNKTLLSALICPFCSSDETKLIINERSDVKKAYIICKKCHARGPLATTKTYLSEELENAAINLWNARGSNYYALLYKCAKLKETETIK